MRRFVAILLIALLPLQAASALVGTVADQLLPRIAANQDQHDHHSVEACAGLAEAADHSQCQEPDDHCSDCHGCCCAPLRSVLPSTIAQLSDAMILAAVRGKPSATLARPERPKWTGLA
ncbi:hypothetical protein [Accumulibacter sp.]|uniref:hypothetical protein n=1 Tax=Accumulibacter sp. TaxID=2053492 RepID=UPI0025DD9794|nr:hypothetical protein [Accumulibacter sp.]MCM8611984.1 hypothetical protein [Accumulibacter sp.]MCM8635844.1 hypothetical protein [Accumulibacter sp.]MCM8641930.1 hypothetical protein [Accumulibacter sp.]